MPADRRPNGAVAKRPHSMAKFRWRFPWVVCKHCGLVGLNNDATRKAIKEGCWKYADER